MNDQNKSLSDGKRQPDWELRLAREVRELDREIQPNRDLWAGIERRIAEHPQPKKAGFTPNWMKFGMAASVLMAFSALVLTMTDARQAGFAPSESVAFQEEPGFDALETMQVEYLRNRDPLIQQFTETNRNLAPETLEELYRNIEIVAQARRDIEAKVRQEPTNRRLVEQLMRIHEQELALLKQDFSQPARAL
jgi:hypothetical protein